MEEELHKGNLYEGGKSICQSAGGSERVYEMGRRDGWNFEELELRVCCKRVGRRQEASWIDSMELFRNAFVLTRVQA